jgi:hypothetical protein
MTAPERIWATPFDIKSDGGTYCDAESRPSAPNKDAWCYRRADLPPTLAQALAVPEIAALVEAAADLAREMAFMLRHNPEKDGGMYRDALNAARAALAALKGGAA